MQTSVPVGAKIDKPAGRQADRLPEQLPEFPALRHQVRFGMALRQRQANRVGLDQDLAVQLNGGDLAVGIQLQVRPGGMFTQLHPFLLDFITQLIGGPAHLAAAIDIGERPDLDVLVHGGSCAKVGC